MNVKLSANDLREIIRWYFAADHEGARPDVSLMSKLETALNNTIEPQWCRCGHVDSHKDEYSQCIAPIGTYCHCLEFRTTRSRM